MDTLISFVNQVFTPELKLGIISKSGKFQWITGDILPISNGITGITQYKDKIYCSFQNNGLGVLDKGFSLLQHYTSDSIKDPHSLTFFEGKLYVVSTGQNTINVLDLNDKGTIIKDELFWQMPDTSLDYDAVHLNSISLSHLGLFATLFGKRTKGQSWQEITTGKLINLTDNSVVLDNLKQPHSLFLNGNNTLLFCESKTGRIISNKGKVVATFKGYIRGLTKQGRQYIVAENARRRLSKSRLGRLSGRINDFEDEQNNQSFLHFLTTKSYSKIKKINLSDFGNEVYDLLPLDKDFIDYSSSNIEKSNMKKIFLMENKLVDFIKEGEKVINQVEEKLEVANKTLKERETKLENRESELAKIKTDISKKEEQIIFQNRAINQLEMNQQQNDASSPKILESIDQLSTLLTTSLHRSEEKELIELSNNQLIGKVEQLSSSVENLHQLTQEKDVKLSALEGEIKALAWGSEETDSEIEKITVKLRLEFNESLLKQKEADLIELKQKEIQKEESLLNKQTLLDKTYKTLYQKEFEVQHLKDKLVYAEKNYEQQSKELEQAKLLSEQYQQESNGFEKTIFTNELRLKQLQFDIENLQKSIEILSKENASKDNELQGLGTTLSKKEKELAERASYVEEKVIEIGELQKSIEVLSKENASKDSELLGLRATSLDKQKELAESTKYIEERNLEIAELQKSIELLSKENDSKENKLLSLQVVLSDKQKKLEESERYGRERANKITDLQKEITKLESLRSTLEAIKDRSEFQELGINRLEEDLLLAKENDSHKRELANLTDKLQLQVTQNDSKDSEIIDLRAVLSSTQEELAESKNYVKEQTIELANLQKEITQLASLRSRLEVIKSKSEFQELGINRLEEDLLLAKENDSHKKEFSIVRTKIEQEVVRLKKQLSIVSIKVAKLIQQNAFLVTTFNKLKIDLEHLSSLKNKEQVDYLIKISSLEKENTKLNDLLNESSNKLNDKTDKLQLKISKVNDLSKENTISLNKINAFSKRVDHLESEKKDIRDSYSWKIGYGITRLIVVSFGWTGLIKK